MSFWETIGTIFTTGIGSYLDLLKEQELAKAGAITMEAQTALERAKAELAKAEAERVTAGKTSFEKALPWIVIGGIGYLILKPKK